MIAALVLAAGEGSRFGGPKAPYVFDGERLVLCVTKRHYRAAKALELLGRREEYQGLVLSVHTPHKAQQDKYHAAIEAAESVLKSSDTFGPRRSYAEKMKDWAREKELSDCTSEASINRISVCPF